MIKISKITPSNFFSIIFTPRKIYTVCFSLRIIPRTIGFNLRIIPRTVCFSLRIIPRTVGFSLRIIPNSGVFTLHNPIINLNPILQI